MTINLPELKRRRGPKCEGFASAAGGRHRDSLARGPPRRPGREAGRAPRRPFPAAYRPPARLVLGISGSGSRPSPPSGSRRGRGEAAQHQAPGGSQVLRCQKEGGKKSYAGKQVRKGLPGGDWFGLEGSATGKALRGLAARTGAPWPRGAGAGAQRAEAARLGRGARTQPPSPHARRGPARPAPGPLPPPRRSQQPGVSDVPPPFDPLPLPLHPANEV